MANDTPEGWTADSVRNVLINPAYCLGNPPIVTKEQYIQANARLISELGAEQWLEMLLSVLAQWEVVGLTKGS